MEAKVHNHLSSFLAQHSLQESVSNIDDIVLSYLLGVLDLIGQGEVEDCFDLEDVTDMMNAYLPGFDQIDRPSVMDWMFKMAAQMKDSGTEGDLKDNESLREVEPKEKKQEEPVPHPKKSSFPKYDFSSSTAQRDDVNIETCVNGKNDKENPISIKTDNNNQTYLTSDADDTKKTLATLNNRTVTATDPHPKDQKSSTCKRKKRYTSVSSQESQEEATKPQLEIQVDLDDCLVRSLLDMFPATCSVEAKHCLHVSNGDMNVAAQLILDRQESGQAITDSKVQTVKNHRKSKKTSDTKLDDASVKMGVIEKYSFYDADEEGRTHKPPPLKNEAKKLVRYRDGRIVSMKGERFSEIKKS